MKCAQIIVSLSFAMAKSLMPVSVIASDNWLSPGRRQAIIWTNAGISFIGPREQTAVKYLSKYIISFKDLHFTMSSWKWRPFCLVLNVLSSSLHLFIWVIYPNSSRLLHWHAVSVKSNHERYWYKYANRVNEYWDVLNTLTPRQIGRQFEDNFQARFLEWKYMKFDG